MHNQWKGWNFRIIPRVEAEMQGKNSKNNKFLFLPPCCFSAQMMLVFLCTREATIVTTTICIVTDVCDLRLKHHVDGFFAVCYSEPPKIIAIHQQCSDTTRQLC